MYFNFKKSLQSAAFLLKQNKKKTLISIELMKYLYLSDKKGFKELGRSITGDQFIATICGPGLNQIFNLIKGEGKGENNEEWNKYIKKTKNIYIKLIKDPGIGELCEVEINILKNTYNEYKNKTFVEMVVHTHEFLEWEKIKKEELPKIIPIEDILESLGILDRLDIIKKRAEESEKIDDFFNN